MIKIDNYEACKTLIDSCRRKRALTNCFFLPNQLKEMIGLEKLYLLEEENIKLFLEKESGFYRTYYFIYDTDNIKPIKVSAPMVIEFPYNKVMTPAQIQHICLLKKMGFRLARESARMSMKPTEVKARNIFLKDISVDYAKTDDNIIIFELLNNTFEKMFAFLPSKEQVDSLITEKKILVCYCSGKIAGLIHMDICKNISWIRQIVVMKEYRGRGIGGILLNRYLAISKDYVNEFMLWVDLSNIAAIDMYKKAGYIFDGRMANEYINKVGKIQKGD